MAVKNFARYQHYKDRHPPWVKLYRDLWRDRDFFRLPAPVKLLYLGLLTVASITDNRIPDDREWIAAELALDAVDLEPLIEAGFLLPVDAPEQVATDAIASCYPSRAKRQRRSFPKFSLIS